MWQLFIPKFQQNYWVFLISNFRRVLNLVCILLGICPACDENCSMPTFRNTLSVPSSKAGCKVWSMNSESRTSTSYSHYSYFILYIQPLKMELIESSETSANQNRTPGKYSKEYIQELLVLQTFLCNFYLHLYITVEHAALLWHRYSGFTYLTLYAT